MPTGILRDIWISLSSLGDHRPSRLEKLWIRFHDNQAALNDAGLAQPPADNPVPTTLPALAASNPQSQQYDLTNPEHYGVNKIVWSDHQVEAPNFSIMPALRSLCVLEIDEVRYLIELSILLRRSLSTLRELRLGIATNLYIPPPTLTEVDAAPLFSGGVWALLMSRIYNPHDSEASTASTDPGEGQQAVQSLDSSSNVQGTELMHKTIGSAVHEASKDPQTHIQRSITEFLAPEKGLSYSSLKENSTQAGKAELEAIDPALCHDYSSPRSEGAHLETSIERTPWLDEVADNKIDVDMDSLEIGEKDTEAPADDMNAHQRLRLEVLEIERLTKLSAMVLTKTIDFTVLTTLTLLQCGDQSVLWERMRKEFAPRKMRITAPNTGLLRGSRRNASSNMKGLQKAPSSDMEFLLKIKKIQTDAVSSEFISFLKTTLAPNSLEQMFLQDTEKAPSTVTLEAIYRGPLRRHRASLTKVLIDSAYGLTTSRLRSATARKWMLNREVLTFITSGKMCKLREFATAIEYKDWHHFLQRLPNIPHLRSLYIPMIYDHPYGGSLNVKDFALGAIDVVALRPEVELCYLGIKNKCFEILEVKQKDGTSKGPGPALAGSDSDDDTQDDDHNDDDDEDSEDGGAATAPQPIEPGAMDSDVGSISTDDDEQEATARKKVKLKLREILFYDDKISIFKARHARL